MGKRTQQVPKLQAMIAGSVFDEKRKFLEINPRAVSRDRRTAPGPVGIWGEHSEATPPTSESRGKCGKITNRYYQVLMRVNGNSKQAFREPEVYKTTHSSLLHFRSVSSIHIHTNAQKKRLRNSSSREEESYRFF